MQTIKIKSVYPITFTREIEKELDLDTFQFELQDYLKDFYDNETFGWDPDPAIAMEKIATQRWVASFDLGLQSWIEWRRTGYPLLVAGPENMNNDKVPQRIPYPTDEAARNPTSLNAGISLLGGADNLDTRVWWDVTENN